ncbi:hypothetical protein C8R44DRAFT_751623 [Mycena epipterygia]|nr:hypothetical protein C8R44DRAFT_751623 [Mycena epipterygia]
MWLMNDPPFLPQCTIPTFGLTGQQNCISTIVSGEYRRRTIALQTPSLIPLLLCCQWHEEPKKSWQTASSTLRVSSFIFHSLLVAVHLALVGIWARGLEQHITVGLDNQKFASFLITATTTAFGTIYSALLVFVTQTLSMRRSLKIDQVLTATHDTAAAWAGIGAAISHLWNQKVVHVGRASIFGVLCATMYLSTIVGLHIPPPRCSLWGHSTQLALNGLGPTVYQHSTAPSVHRFSPKWSMRMDRYTSSRPFSIRWFVIQIYIFASTNFRCTQWGTWYNLIPASDFSLDAAGESTETASAADVYLIQKLNLPAANLNETLNVTLHDVENALSTVVASVFWIWVNYSPIRSSDFGPSN